MFHKTQAPDLASCSAIAMFSPADAIRFKALEKENANLRTLIRIEALENEIANLHVVART